ncbi:hypothetical protein ACWCQL_10555 [Streptomyces sp. NPDC002073]
MGPNKDDPPDWWERLKRTGRRVAPWIALAANTLAVMNGIQGK